MNINTDSIYEVTITTPKGTIVMDLDPQLAPNTVNNFVNLANDGYYTGLTWHRVVPDFVIQGGCPEGSGRGGPGYRFPDEPVTGEYTVGALAMANSGPDTNGIQFFVITGPSGVALPPAYAMFGKVVSGLEVATAIQEVSTAPGDRPTTDVVIESVTITEAD